MTARSARLLAATLLPLGLAAASPAGDAESLRPVAEGALYELGSERQTLLFVHVLFASDDGQRRRSVFFDPAGRVVTVQELWLHEGGIARYVLQHPRAGRAGVLEHEADRLRYSWTRDGRTRTGEEDWVPNLVVGPSLVPAIQEHWQPLLAGETLHVRLGVLFRRTSYGFELERVAPEAGEPEDDRVRIRLRARSFLIRRIVDPVHFTLSRDGRVLLEVQGRTAPLREVDGTWDPVDVEGVYRPLSAGAAASFPGPRLRSSGFGAGWTALASGVER